MELLPAALRDDLQLASDGAPIFREGDAGDAWFVIYEGLAEVNKDAEFLPSRRIATLGPRACFGEMAILDHSPRSASVIARGDVTVFRFPRKDFEQLLDEGNLAAYKLIYEMAKVLAARTRATNQQLSEALSEHDGNEALRGASTSVVQGHSISE